MRKAVATTATAGGPFFFATTKNRIGLGTSLLLRPLQAGHSPLRQRRIESDAEGRCGDGRSRRAIFHRHDDYTASIPKFDPEIKNRCTKEGVNGEKLTSIPKFDPEIKNRCSQEGVNGHILAAIAKFTPWNQESLQEVAHLQHAPSARPQPRSHPAPPTF